MTGEAAPAGSQPDLRDARAAARDGVNQAVRVEVVSIEEAPIPSEADALAVHRPLVVATRWENIHPRQKVAKSKLEGKTDRTMGVGALARGGDTGDEEWVEVDVAYTVPRWGDHVYLLADGVAYPLDERSEEIDGGVSPASPLELAEHGSVATARLLFAVPEQSKNLALRHFDYSYGHITVPVRGKERLATGDGRPPKGLIAEAATPDLQLATVAVDFRAGLGGLPAPTGHRWVVARLVGKSLSRGGAGGNIIEIDPRASTWLVTDGGYLHPAERQAVLRFIPEIFQHQEVAFLLPREAERLELGARVGNQVLRLALTARAPRGLPDAAGRHLDGEVMEVLLFGSRREGEHVVLDLCVRPLLEARGLEIQPAAQFLLRAGATEAKLDSRATAVLAHPPPEPFVVPPGTPVRFELAYRTSNTPESLTIRGFETEGRIVL